MAGCMVMLLMSKLLATGEKPLCLAPYCKSAAYQQQVVRMKKHPFFDGRHYVFRTNHRVKYHAGNATSPPFTLMMNNHLVSQLILISDHSQTMILTNTSAHTLYGEPYDGLLFHAEIDIPVGFSGTCTSVKKLKPHATCELSYWMQNNVAEYKSYFWLSGVEFTGSAFLPFAKSYPVLIPVSDISIWEKITPPFKGANGNADTTVVTPIDTMATMPVAIVSGNGSESTQDIIDDTKPQGINPYRWIYTNSTYQDNSNTRHDWIRPIEDYKNTPVSAINTGKKVFQIQDSGRSVQDSSGKTITNAHIKRFCTLASMEMEIFRGIVDYTNDCTNLPGSVPNFTHVNASVNTPKEWLLAMESGLFLSTDQGTTFHSISGFRGENVNIVLNSDAKIYAGVRNGASATTNGLYKISLTALEADNDKSWDKIAVFSGTSGHPGTIVYTLLNVDGRIYAGTEKGLYKQQIKGNDDNWSEVTTLAGKKIRSLFNTGESVFAGTEADGMYRSDDNGQSWMSVSCNKYNNRSSTETCNPPAGSGTTAPNAHAMPVLANFHQNIMLAPMNDPHDTALYRGYTSVNNGKTWDLKGMAADSNNHMTKQMALLTGQAPWLISANQKLYINLQANHLFDYDKQSWLPVKFLNPDGTDLSTLPKILSLTDVINISYYKANDATEAEKLADLPAFITTDHGIYTMKKLYKPYQLEKMGYVTSRLPDLYQCAVNAGSHPFAPSGCQSKNEVKLTVKPFGTALQSKKVYTFNYLPSFDLTNADIKETQKLTEVSLFAGTEDGLYRMHYNRADFKNLLMNDALGGKTWVQESQFKGKAVRALERTGDRLYAATATGLYYTTDGSSWSKADDADSFIKISDNTNIVSLRYTGSGLYVGTKADNAFPAMIYYTMDLRHWHILPLLSINRNNRANSTDQLSPDKVQECRIMYRSGTGVFVSLIPKPAHASEEDAKGLWLIYRPDEVATWRPYPFPDNYFIDAPGSNIRNGGGGFIFQAKNGDIYAMGCITGLQVLKGGKLDNNNEFINAPGSNITDGSFGVIFQATNGDVYAMGASDRLQVLKGGKLDNTNQFIVPPGSNITDGKNGVIFQAKNGDIYAMGASDRLQVLKGGKLDNSNEFINVPGSDITDGSFGVIFQATNGDIYAMGYDTGLQVLKGGKLDNSNEFINAPGSNITKGAGGVIFQATNGDIYAMGFGTGLQVLKGGKLDNSNEFINAPGSNITKGEGGVIFQATNGDIYAMGAGTGLQVLKGGKLDNSNEFINVPGSNITSGGGGVIFQATNGDIYAMGKKTELQVLKGGKLDNSNEFINPPGSNITNGYYGVIFQATNGDIYAMGRGTGLQALKGGKLDNNNEFINSPGSNITNGFFGIIFQAKNGDIYAMGRADDHVKHGQLQVLKEGFFIHHLN